MFKKFKVVLSSLLTVLILTTPVFASSVNNVAKSEVVYEKPLITDMDVLYEKATNGISDIKEGKIVHNAKLTNKEKGQDKEIKTYSTTQLQKTTKDSNGNSVDTYVTTTFAVVNTSDLEENVSNSSSGTMTIQSYDGNKGDSKWDKTGGVKAYSTVYWNNSTYGSLSFVNMAGQTLTGGWTFMTVR